MPSRDRSATDPHWYRDAVIYELHVRAFHDSNGDGIGDFVGLTEKLDYLEGLGVTALWLLPFYPSPLRDDGYDIADYSSINGNYGSMRDFKRFLREAHRRELKVITELVINHTSVEHPWFQRARRAPAGSAYRDFYVWTNDPTKYRDARVIFRDFETSNWTWDPEAQAYYWHRFYSHQPDLNFDNPRVEQAVLKVLDFWLSMGVDGLRLDAIPYLHEREETDCENLPETHQFLKRLRAHVDAKHESKMLLAEANQWPEDAAAYFGDGDECHMNFHFPLMPRLFMSLQQEDARPIIDIIEHTPQVHESCQWAIFLRNHDELTLEMVTEEDRDYMYRAYADDTRARINLGIRRRLAPLLRSRRKVELMNGLLFSLPGTPVLYYGDELGMGDNVFLGDRNGVRTPMQWSGDRNAGFSRANPQMLYLPPITDPEYHYEAVNVEAQARNPSSLLAWMKRLIHLRKSNPVFGRGTLEFVESGNPRILAFVREHGGDRVLVVANLSRFMQHGRLELERFAGSVPTEMFGRNPFPEIGQDPYFLSLSPHGFCWFALQSTKVARASFEDGVLQANGSWRDAFVGARAELEQLLPAFLREQRWFRAKGRDVRAVAVVDAVEVPGSNAEIAILEVSYKDQDAERYVLPMSFAANDLATAIRHDHPGAIIGRIRVETAMSATEGVLYDATIEPAFATALLQSTRARATLPGRTGQIGGGSLRGLRQISPDELARLPASVGRAEQSNTSVIFGNRFIMKLFRVLEEGQNPDVEIGRFLTLRKTSALVPKLAGFVEYRAPGRANAAVAMVQDLVANEGDGWSQVLATLGRFVDRCQRKKGGPPEIATTTPLLERARSTLSPGLARLLGDQRGQVALLARRTADLHLALASDSEAADFAPELFNAMHQRSLYEGARVRLDRTFRLVERKLPQLPADTRTQASEVLARKKEIDARLRRVVDARIEARRIRVHGDYHLGQVLWTGSNYVIIDFEGEPARPLSERRFKRSPLVDVAGMLRSFHYAAVTAHRDPRLRGPQRRQVRPWLEAWHAAVSAVFLATYVEALGDDLLPPEDEHLALLLDFFVLDKCIYEIGYELNNRPDWLAIPLEGIRGILDA